MQLHQTMFGAMGVVFVAKGNVLSIERHDSMIGNGDPMGVATQITQYLHGTAEGRLGVNEPVFPVQATQHLAKRLGRRQYSGGT